MPVMTTGITAIFAKHYHGPTVLDLRNNIERLESKQISALRHLRNNGLDRPAIYLVRDLLAWGNDIQFCRDALDRRLGEMKRVDG